ncbi:MAG: ferredoxin [Streptococcaceae bacterium]|jgi:ferredoxin|nr:ferredoxin [Streptococcaceae bacterium]
MKITLIPEKCIACGLCHLYAATTFDYDDNGIVKFYNSDKSSQFFENPETQEGQIKAIKHCPTGALLLLED